MKGGGTRLKGGGVPWYHPLGERLHVDGMYCIGHERMGNLLKRLFEHSNFQLLSPLKTGEMFP